jgi:hypothetical protein
VFRAVAWEGNLDEVAAAGSSILPYLGIRARRESLSSDSLGRGIMKPSAGGEPVELDVTFSFTTLEVQG